MHGEDHSAATRVVVEDRLDRRVGEHSSVPVELVADADGRKFPRFKKSDDATAVLLRVD